MDQTDRHERQARGSGVAPRKSAPFLSCAPRQQPASLPATTDIAPPWRASASVRFAVPATHMLAYVRARLLGYAKGARLWFS